MHLPIDLLPMVMGNSGRTRQLEFPPLMEPHKDYPLPAHALWLKQPLDQYTPVPVFCKVLSKHQNVSAGFARLLDRGTPGHIGVRC